MVLGLHSGLHGVGWGVVSSSESRLAYVAHGAIKPPPSLVVHRRLFLIFEGLAEVAALYPAHDAAIEADPEMDADRALEFGQVRASAVVALAKAGLAVSEYASSAMRRAVADNLAGRNGIAFAVRRLFPAAHVTCAYAAAALAVAMTHATVCRTRLFPS
ncbi:crossover junction endodeoxyribonuclease RuvC [Phenylobacterium sp.]|uniref:crossover junction endodeoxyribonuclease RuvC n=1 Tax=Phenylobacterium sp. TaxID=1871053 RepID=UPI002FCB39C3